MTNRFTTRHLSEYYHINKGYGRAPMPLSKEEINSLIDKLRQKYDEYAEKYSMKWFDNGPFEDRLRMAVKNKMNLEGFILAEITNFEKLKEKYDKKKNEKSFSATVENIIEENTARIRRHPRIEFHPSAGFEISHFYGALAEFTQFYLPVLWILEPDDEAKKSLLAFENSLNFQAMPRGNKPSKRIEDHALLLSRKGITELEIERDASHIMKDCAFLLHEIIDYCGALLEERRAQWENPLRFDKLYLEESRKKRMIDIFSGTTGYGAILAVSEYAGAVIEDFRLQAFRR